jgi:hypothetical protein
MLSYSAINSRGKATFGSVEGWNMNHSVIREPPKSGTCRRIDKVDDTNEYLLRVAEGTDRFNDAIQLYPRGINHAVGVNYSNSGSGVTSFHQGQSYLPYRVNREGSFRPPIVPLSDLLPLSRQPRNVTEIPANRTQVDWSKLKWGGLNENSKTRDIKELIRTQAAAAKSMANEFSAMHQRPEDHELSPFISNKLNTAVESNHAYMQQKYVFDPFLAEQSALARQGNVLKGSMVTNLKKENGENAWHSTDFNRLGKKISITGSDTIFNVSKPPLLFL